MREIKFRAYQDNEMLNQKLGGVYATKRFLDHLCEDTKLMQYTGLKDKNGVEIYEGDIVKRDNFIGEIKYGEAHFYISWKREACDFNDVLRWHHEDIEVIGNIHENKDML